MTVMLSFRTDPSVVSELDAAAAEAGVARSDLLNRAVRELLYRMRCERDAERYSISPLNASEIDVWTHEARSESDTDWAEVFGS